MVSVLRWAFVVVSAIFFTYACVSIYDELRLIRLLNSAPSKDDPVIYEGHTFKNARTMEVYQLEKRREKFHSWTGPLEEWLALPILASCAGFLGSLFRFLVDSVLPRKSPKIALCLLGLGIGICLMAVAWVSETFLLEGELRFRPERLAAVCFLAGIFVQESWKYVSIKGPKTFEHDN